MSLTLRNRIAFFYIAATALLTALLFIIIFTATNKTVFNHLDEKLLKESEEVQKGLYFGGDTVKLINMYEWSEHEHSQVEVNPAFLMVTDKSGILIKKSDNLYKNILEFKTGINETNFFNSSVDSNNIRQVQIPLRNPAGNNTGYILIGLPMDDALLVLTQLKWALVIGFIGALLILFLFARWMAGKSIQPMQKVILAAEKITKENIDKRIELPVNKDEIYTLTTTVNSLLDRLEDAVLREKQFTSDASHELRTPLSVIKGTLEVLIRKPREIKQYEEKISYCILEVDRMTSIIDQLLLLARYESGKIKPIKREIFLSDIVMYMILRTETRANEKGIVINYKDDNKSPVLADPSMLEVILENLISNAIKYSNGNKQIDICILNENNYTKCIIKDYGIGMNKDELARIFDKFYRSEKARSSCYSGDGIGLAIVKRLSDLQDIGISYTSEPGKGTAVSLSFKS